MGGRYWPGAGKHGGELVAEGTPAQVQKYKSLTGQYLAGEFIEAPKNEAGNGRKFPYSAPANLI